MMSTVNTTATTPVVPPCVLQGVSRGGVVSGGVPSKRWTRGGSNDPVLSAFSQAGDGIGLTHCSSINNGGGLRTRVEVTHRP